MPLFRAKKNKDPISAITDVSDRLNRRGELINEKIKRLDSELIRINEQIKRTRPGPIQEGLKSRKSEVSKQKEIYESQRNTLHNQSFRLDRVSSAAEDFRDAQQTMTALNSAIKELKELMKVEVVDMHIDVE